MKRSPASETETSVGLAKRAAATEPSVEPLAEGEPAMVETSPVEMVILRMVELPVSAT